MALKFLHIELNVRIYALLVSVFLLACANNALADDGPVDAATGTAPAAGEPGSFLKFEDVLDGRCYILSAGGKLTVMHNTHPEHTIRFRLIRFFANKRQRGRATGDIAPGDKPTKLGCSQVDGRPQEWRIERASFVTEEQVE